MRDHVLTEIPPFAQRQYRFEARRIPAKQYFPNQEPTAGTPGPD